MVNFIIQLIWMLKQFDILEDKCNPQLLRFRRMQIAYLLALT